MRDILFRAKVLHHSTDEKWVAGFYCCHQDMITDISDDKALQHHYIMFDEFADFDKPKRFYRVEVDPETVCEYTGIKDSAGHYIFEHDYIMLSKWNEVYEVIYCPERGGYMVKAIKTSGMYRFPAGETVHIVGDAFNGMDERYVKKLHN